MTPDEAQYDPSAGPDISAPSPGFGAAAMWVPWMAIPRYRREGVPVSPIVPIAMGLGALAIIVAIYAFIVIWAASGGVMLPAPDYWLPQTQPSAPGVPT